MKANMNVTPLRGAQVCGCCCDVSRAMLQREMLDEVDVWVKNGIGATLLLFMSRRLWSLRRNLVEGNSFSLLAKQARVSQTLWNL